MKSFSNILVVSRSTKNCVKVLRTGVALARKFEAKLHVLHIIHDPFNVNGWNLPVPSLDEEYKAMVAQAREELDLLKGSVDVDPASRALALRRPQLRQVQAELTAAGHGQITTEILPLDTFYYAEDYHQQFLAKNPSGYCGLGGTGVSCPRPADVDGRPALDD